MIGVRKIIGFVVVLAIVAFASPSFADNGKKIYNLQMQMVSVPPAVPIVVAAKITNEGNSTISSFSIFVSGLTITGFQRPASGTVAHTGSSVSVTNMSPLKSGQSFTLTLSVNSCGEGVWSPTAWTGAKLNGQTFDLDLAPGRSNLATPISCGDVASGAPFVVPDSINPNCVTGQRGYYDKDGSHPAGALQFFVTNTVSANDQLHFRWPDLAEVLNNDPAATFKYSVCGTGGLPDDTQVAWLNIDGSPAGTPGTPAYVEALDCIEPNRLPTPYGTLTADLAQTDAPTIAINTTTPPREAPPGHAPGSIDYPGSPPVSPDHPGPAFDIVIGTERITVQLVCLDIDSDGWDAGDCTDTDGEGTALMVVQRGVAGTPVTTHPTGALVMSTPLPLMVGSLPPYSDGTEGHLVQAQMCISGQSESGPEDNPTAHSTTFIDIGDGWVKGP